MEFNNCSQCGTFYLSSGKLCPNCATKETIKIQKLENYLENNTTPDTLEELSYGTGISVKDLNKFINENNKFSNLNNIINFN